MRSSPSLIFHDGDWLSATITLVVSAIYWVVRPRDRAATNLFLFGSIAWWVGYGGLTKLGGLLLAPPFRSESWGGVLGILIFLLYHLSQSKNRAALRLAQYGLLAGGVGFVLAVFVRHPFRMDVGFLANWALETFLEDRGGKLWILHGMGRSLWRMAPSARWSQTCGGRRAAKAFRCLLRICRLDCADVDEPAPSPDRLDASLRFGANSALCGFGRLGLVHRYWRLADPHRSLRSRPIPEGEPGPRARDPPSERGWFSSWRYSGCKRSDRSCKGSRSTTT